MKDLKIYESASVSRDAFKLDFTSNVLRQYLFFWKDTIEIDHLFNPDESTWMLSEKVLQSFWLLSPNKKDETNIWVFKWEDEESTLLELENKWWIYKEIADAIKYKKNDEIIEIDNLSEEELWDKLKQYYNWEESKKVIWIFLFWIKYWQLIRAKKYSLKNIVKNSWLNDSYLTELTKAVSLSDHAIIKDNKQLLIKNSSKDLNDNSRLKGWFNKIYYGIPGCGKSYQVNKIFNKNEYEVFRTTFYPDYSNSDFVWQIIPKVKEWNVTYDFQEWPFTEALLFALKNPGKKVCLIIEEINRWNASAIFWDIFQLLDRDANWNSQYEIDNFAIKEYINKKWDWKFDKVFIPSNLRIISTMNTSDQNVYTLDTAFQRRRLRERILNEFRNDNDFSNLFIPWSTCTWKYFVETINRAILNKNPAWLNWEDKQLWVYFVSRNELVDEHSINNEENKKAFVEKVLRYIWDDVSKLDPSQWFIADIKSFDDLVNAFNTKNLKVFKELFDDLDAWNEN